MMRDVLLWAVMRLWGFAGEVLVKILEERYPGASLTITPTWEEET